MKKIKVFLALIFSLVCMFSLVACGGNNGYYLDGSLDADIYYFSSIGDVSASVKFQVSLPDAATYEISYTLDMYYLDGQIGSERFTTTYKSSGNEIADISQYWSVDYSSSNANSSFFYVSVSNVVVKTKSSGLSEYSGLAIGFGVVGGLMLIGLTALYVYLKKQENKQQAA